jgi:tRNA A37 N6-isopentenylltransferase MiaA
VTPILVGGTHYYIESVLWDTLIANEPVPGADSGGKKHGLTNDIDQLRGKKKTTTVVDMDSLRI